MGRLPFDRLLSRLSTLIYNELCDKQINCFASFAPAPENAIKVSLLDVWNNKERESDSSMELKLKHWAKELSCKIARPFDITTFKQEVPHNTHENGIVIPDTEGQGVIIRGIVDYCIESQYDLYTDKLLYRFDVLCNWSDN